MVDQKKRRKSGGHVYAFGCFFDLCVGFYLTIWKRDHQHVRGFSLKWMGGSNIYFIVECECECWQQHSKHFAPHIPFDTHFNIYGHGRRPEPLVSANSSFFPWSLHCFVSSNLTAFG